MTTPQDASGTPNPLLSTVEHGEEVRELAFALLLRDHRPIDAEALARGLGLSSAATSQSVEALARDGRLDLDDAGRIAGAAGMSLMTGPHRLTIDAFPFRTWCAYDSVGIAAALEADADIETACGVCGTPISLAMRAGEPDRDGPERLWLSGGGADLRGSFCTPTVLLCGSEHAAAWATAQDGHGRLLDLSEAARLGATAWAGCADAARRLA